MINTGLQQSPGTTHPSQRTAQVLSQLLAGFMDAVGQISFSMSPHLFNGVQFRRITREAIDMQTWLPGQKRLDFPTSVDFTAVPNDEHMASQMTQQLAQERNNSHAVDVVGMKPRVKSQPSPSGRNGQNTDDRYFVPPVTVPQDRGLANGSPCPTDVGNQQKSALVEKPQMGSKSFGLFLYVAKPAPSTAEFYPRPVATPASRAFDSSSSVPGVTTSIRLRTCTGSHTAFQQVSQSASMSTTPWSVLPPRRPSATSFADRPSVPASGGSVAPSEHAFSIPSDLLSDGFDSIEPRCSRTHQLHRPRHEKIFPYATTPRPGTCATPIVHGFHVVSCQYSSMYPLNVKDQYPVEYS